MIFIYLLFIRWQQFEFDYVNLKEKKINRKKKKKEKIQNGWLIDWFSLLCLYIIISIKYAKRSINLIVIEVKSKAKAKRNKMR